jgi:hypothetical protein
MYEPEVDPIIHFGEPLYGRQFHGRVTVLVRPEDWHRLWAYIDPIVIGRCDPFAPVEILIKTIPSSIVGIDMAAGRDEAVLTIMRDGHIIQ